MPSTFFSDPAVTSDLLAACQGEGWLSPTLLQKTQVLLEHGLHPEQALIGTGLLSIDQYGEALTHIFDVPFVRLTDSASKRTLSRLVDAHLLQQCRAEIIDQDGSTLLVAFADPSDGQAMKRVTKAVEAKGLVLVPAVTLWSDMRAKQSLPVEKYSTVGSYRRELYEALEKAATKEVEFGHDGRGWHVRHQGVGSLPHRFAQLPASALSALTMHLSRHSTHSEAEWQVEKLPTSHGVFVSLKRTSPLSKELHPLAWSAVLQAFIEHPTGILIMIVPPEDLQLSREQYGWMNQDLLSHWRTHARFPHIYHVQEEEGQEAALHAGLSGRPVVAVQPKSDFAWVQPLLASRTPVSVLERHRFPQGMAWSSRSL